MANAMYTKGDEGLLDGSIDVLSDTIKAIGVGAGYTATLATDKFLSDIPSGQIICTFPTLTSKTATNGVFKAANITLGSVTGSGIDFVVLYKDTGSPSTSRLILFIDTATGLPFTPSGGPLTVTWDTAGIFTL